MEFLFFLPFENKQRNHGHSANPGPTNQNMEEQEDHVMGLVERVFC